MSSSSAPIYYFQNIDFNDSFFTSTKTASTLTTNNIIPPSGTLTLGNSTSTITIPGSLNLSNAVSFFTTTATPSANVTISNTNLNGRYYSFGGIKFFVGNFRVTYSSASQNSGIISFTLPTSFMSSIYSCSIGQTTVSNTNLGFYSCVSSVSGTAISFYIICSGTPSIGNFIGISYFISGV